MAFSVLPRIQIQLLYSVSKVCPNKLGSKVANLSKKESQYNKGQKLLRLQRCSKLRSFVSLII